MWQIEFFFRVKGNSIKRTLTEIIFIERGSGTGTISPSTTKRYDAILMHEGAKASSLDQP